MRLAGSSRSACQQLNGLDLQEYDPTRGESMCFSSKVSVLALVVAVLNFGIFRMYYESLRH
jgi:hypothetical protein